MADDDPRPLATPAATPAGYWRLQSTSGRYHVLLEKRAVAVNAGLLLALMAASLLYLSLGNVALALVQCWRRWPGRGR